MWPSPFGREKILTDTDWHARIGRGERARIVRECERHARTQACTVPILWYNRIVPTRANIKGWKMTPSQYIGQDLADVWLDR
jgi:peptide/nickel transport system substrate-binding protein